MPDDVPQAFRIERFRQAVAFTESHGGRRQRGPAAGRVVQRTLRLPALTHPGLAPGMPELDRRDAALPLHEAGQPGQRFDLCIVPQAKVSRTDASLRYNGRRFDDDQTGAANRTTAVMHEMPVAGHAVLGRILAHRRDADPVGHLNRAQGKRSKQMAHGNLPKRVRVRSKSDQRRVMTCSRGRRDLGSAALKSSAPP